jgi:iron complex transport system ATP-binding protein
MMIQAEEVSVSYGPRKVLDGISFSAAEGEFFCVLGPNGSGKTTLMKRLCGILDGEGRVKIAGREMRSLGRRQIARLVAVVPQRSSLSGGLTVRETVEMGRYAEESRASAGDSAIVEGIIHTLGLDFCAHRDVATLSGGEFQKVLLARALAQRSRILILDEATAHLDIHHALEIFLLVQALARSGGLTVLAVLHDINLAAAFADRIMLLDGGRCAGIHEPEKILTPEALRDVFHIEADILRASGGNIAIAPKLDGMRNRQFPVVPKANEK